MMSFKCLASCVKNGFLKNQAIDFIDISFNSVIIYLTL
jgi:hypothetical protein